MIARRKLEVGAAAVFFGSLLMKLCEVDVQWWVAAFYRSPVLYSSRRAVAAAGVAPALASRRQGLRVEALAYRFEPLAVRSKVLAAEARCRAHLDRVRGRVEQELDVIDK